MAENSENTKHRIKAVGGRYKCTCGDLNTLNRWVAEAHVEEAEGVDLNGDKPDWL